MLIYQRKIKENIKVDKEPEIVLEVEMEITINLKEDLNSEIMIEMVETIETTEMTEMIETIETIEMIRIIEMTKMTETIETIEMIRTIEMTEISIKNNLHKQSQPLKKTTNKTNKIKDNTLI